MSDDPCISLLRELVSAALLGIDDSAQVVAFAQRLRQKGIEVIPSLAGASLIMAAHSEDAEEVPDNVIGSEW